MILIVGGAYQGKLKYATDRYLLSDDDIFYCENKSRIDFCKKVIYGLDRLILNQLKAGIDPAAYIDENIEAMKDKIIICTDIFCGIVPVDALMRRWRDDTGRIMIRLANESDSVIRIFLGMEQIIK